VATQIFVKSTRKSGSSTVIDVELTDGSSKTSHEVHVSDDDLARWGGGSTLEELVRRSFEFLLKREPKDSILRRFDLSVIQQYFPEYDRVMRG
jgi:hypothetical protein